MAPATAFIDDVRTLLLGMPGPQKDQFKSFWARVRTQLNAMDEENITLVQDLAAARAAVRSPMWASSASRPTTSDSVNQLRNDVQVALDADSSAIDSDLNIMQAIRTLSPGWVRAKLQADRSATAEAAIPKWSALNCWMKSEETGPGTHPLGYTKVNLRNTFRPDNPTVKIGVQAFRHQLAVVAAGHGPNLLLTTTIGGTHAVSHLCHNGRCFNPDHLIVESKETNRLRWGCVGAWQTKCGNCGVIYHPCPHGGVEHRALCMLPRASPFAAGAYYQNSPTGPQLLQH